MADDADIAQEQVQRQIEHATQQAARDIPQGQPGDCETCGEWFGRLVRGMCAPCRDKYGVG